MQLEEFLITIGDRIRTIRRQKGINQQMLAQLCNFEKSNMSRIESGRCNLTLKNLLKIATALEVSTCDLIEERPKRGPKKTQQL